MSRFLIAIAAGLLIAGGSAPSSPANTASHSSPPGRAPAGAVEHFTATAVTVAKAGLRPTSTKLEIVIDRWSTNAERDRLIATLKNETSHALLSLIRGLPSVGHLSTTTSSGTSLRFAESRQAANGGRQILIVTERPMSVGTREARGRRVSDFPFSLVDLRIDSTGSGEGTLAYAAQLLHNKNTGAIEIGNYVSEPIRLTGVRSVRGQ
jgi:hypothetical protein